MLNKFKKKNAQLTKKYILRIIHIQNQKKYLNLLKKKLLLIKIKITYVLILVVQEEILFII